MSTLEKTLGLALAGLMLAACGGKEAPAPEPSPVAEAPVADAPSQDAPAAEPPTGAVAAAEQEPTAEEIPVPADFEEAAEEEISEDNYVAELDKLQAELDELEAMLDGNKPMPGAKK